jgi:hypothetical protein
MNELLRAGAREGGYEREVPSVPTVLAALQLQLGHAMRGDVCVVMAHVDRVELFRWLESEGFRPVGADRLRELLVS